MFEKIEIFFEVSMADEKARYNKAELFRLRDGYYV